MTISSAICNSFKTELLAMTPHTAGDTYKLVLIKSSASRSYGADQTAVGTPGTSTPSTSNLGTDAVPTSGTYPLAGVELTNFSATLDGSTAILTWDDPGPFTSATISADGAILYNSTRSNKAVAVFSFGATVSSLSGSFDLVLPEATASTALIRWS